EVAAAGCSWRAEGEAAVAVAAAARAKAGCGELAHRDRGRGIHGEGGGGHPAGRGDGEGTDPAAGAKAKAAATAQGVLLHGEGALRGAGVPDVRVRKCAGRNRRRAGAGIACWNGGRHDRTRVNDAISSDHRVAATLKRDAARIEDRVSTCVQL